MHRRYVLLSVSWWAATSRVEFERNDEIQRFYFSAAVDAAAVAALLRRQSAARAAGLTAVG